MVDAVKDFIEEGKLQLFCVDSIDLESWSKKWGSYQERIEQHERWFNYIVNEAIPRFRQIHNDTAWENYQGKFMTTGCSMGALHSANFFFRRPDIFDNLIALSGLYDAKFFFPNYSENLIYNNSPIDYLKNIPWNHYYLDMYRNSKIVICVGQGRWEDECRVDTTEMKNILKNLQVPAWVDYWGYDVDHDWPWWKIQLPYFLKHML